jgi:hypothetical protein
VMPYYACLTTALLLTVISLRLCRKSIKGTLIIFLMAAIAALSLAVAPFARRVWMTIGLEFAWLAYVYAVVALVERGVIGPRKNRPPSYLHKLATAHPRLSAAVISGGLNWFFIVVIGLTVMSQWKGWASAMIYGWPADKTWLWLAVIWSAATSVAVFISSFFVRDWSAAGLGTGFFLTVLLFGVVPPVFGLFPPLTLWQRLFLGFACTVSGCLAGLICSLVRNLARWLMRGASQGI